MKTMLYFYDGPLDGLVMNYKSSFKSSSLYPFPPVSFQFPGSPIYGLTRETKDGYIYLPGHTFLAEKHFNKLFSDGVDKPNDILNDKDIY